MRKLVPIACTAMLCLGLAGCGEKAAELQPVIIQENPIVWGNHVSGYYKSAKQLDTGNPWRADMNIERLPVYKNGCYNANGGYSGLDEDAMIERINVQLERWGNGTSGKYERTDLDRDGKTDCISTMSSTVNIQAYANGLILVFDTSVPPALELLMKPEVENEEVSEEIGHVLLDKLGGYIDFLSIKLAVSTSYLSGAPLYCVQSYFVYDDAGDDVEDILNYNFRRAEMGCSTDGVILTISDSLCASEKLGDYPIISADEARKMISDTEVVYTELVYNTSPQEKILAPYYCFWVQVDDYEPQDEYEKFIFSTGVYDGMTRFEIRFVPAIREEYIAK